jgi:hypothetical protein
MLSISAYTIHVKKLLSYPLNSIKLECCSNIRIGGGLPALLAVELVCVLFLQIIFYLETL